jgi:large subunit ribosomal protein L21
VYAIVKTGGKQYRVEAGQRLLVERLPVKEGGELTLEPIMYRSDQTVLDKAGLEKVKVTAKVIEHVRGEKLRVLKFKPKRGYKRRTGHRQELTRIEVAEIKTGAAGGGSEAKAKEPVKAKAPAKPKQPAKPKAAPKARAKPAAESEAKGTSAGAAKPRSRAKAKDGAQSGAKRSSSGGGAAKAKEEKPDGA